MHAELQRGPGHVATALLEDALDVFPADPVDAERMARWGEHVEAGRKDALAAIEQKQLGKRMPRGSTPGWGARRRAWAVCSGRPARTIWR